MKRVGIVVHDQRVEAASLAARLAVGLRDGGHLARIADADADESTFADGLDLAVSLGGDGTILRTVGLLGSREAPILGVNFGQLGYLTAIEPDAAVGAIDRFFRGDFSIETRMLLEVAVSSADPALDGTSWLALNEATLERPVSQSTVRLAVDIDGAFFTTYAADGLIVATPTGSTAYAFSVRGPIIDATHRAVLLTPISPHMLFDRSLVLRPETVVRIEVSSRPASLSVDGRTIGTLVDRDAVLCRASDRSVRLVTFGPRNFHAVLKAKFGLNDR